MSTRPPTIGHMIVVTALCLIAFAFIILSLREMTGQAQGGWCPIKPLTPMNCEASSARCQCDQNGNCYWVWTRCNR